MDDAGQVGKQASVGIDPPGRQPATGADEHPEVGIAGKVDEKRIQPMIAGDPVGRISVQHDKRAGGRPGQVRDRRKAGSVFQATVQ